MSVLADISVSKASLIFDIAAIVVLLGFVVFNARRGFSRGLVSVIGYVLAIIIGGVLGDVSATTIYDSILQQQNVSNVEDVLSDCDVSSALRKDIKTQTYGISISEDKLKTVISTADSLYAVINKSGDAEILSTDEIDALVVDSIATELGEPLRKEACPGIAVDYMLNYMRSNPDRLYSTATILLQDDTTATAEYVENKFIRPIVVYILKMAIFFIAFFVVMVAVKLVSNAMENAGNTVNTFGTTDVVLGAVLGIVEGCVALIVLSVVLKLLVLSDVNTSTILSDSAIQSTRLFKYIYSIDAVKPID